MEFRAKKFLEDQGSELLRLEFSWVSPYVPVYAPVYLHLTRNQRFVAVKGPLDFFTPIELERYYPFELLFLHPFVQKVDRYKQAGRMLLRVFSFELKWEGGVTLPLTPYEISDQVLRTLGPLFGEKLQIDPYFILVVIQEFLGPLDVRELQSARETDVHLYEKGLFYSAWATFVALLYGWTDVAWLRAWRERAFHQAAYPQSTVPELVGEPKLLDHITREVFSGSHQMISALKFYELRSLVALKLCSRLDRIKSEWNAEAGRPDSLQDAGGFAGGEGAA